VLLVFTIVMSMQYVQIQLTLIHVPVRTTTVEVVIMMKKGAQTSGLLVCIT